MRLSRFTSATHLVPRAPRLGLTSQRRCILALALPLAAERLALAIHRSRRAIRARMEALPGDLDAEIRTRAELSNAHAFASACKLAYERLKHEAVKP